jgi:hypothetical protein
MKGLTLIALVLILLSAQSACGDEELRVENVKVYTIIPLNIEYPLFEYGSCKNLTFDDKNVGSVFEFNDTPKNEIFGHLNNSSRVATPRKHSDSIEFTLTNQSNYYIFLLPDMLVIKHTIRSDEWLDKNEYWSEKNNDVSGVVKENFFGDSPILPRLDGARPLDENGWCSKAFTVIIVDPDCTKPRINDTNLESYARFLLLPQNESIKIERTGAGKFIAYHKSKEVALIPNDLVHPYHVWDFLPFIELIEIIIPISEERIKIVESEIDDSSVIMGRNLADLTGASLMDILQSILFGDSEIPDYSPAKDYETDIDILTDLKKKEQEALLNSNMDIINNIFEEFECGCGINYWKHSLTDDINELNRRIDRLDDQYYITLNYAALQEQIKIAWGGIILSLFVAIGAVCYNYKQLKHAKDASKKQTEQLDNIRKLLIKFHRIIILHKKK